MKIKIRIRRQVKLENLFLFLAMFAVFSFAMLEHVSVTIPAFSLVKFPLLYVGGACILTQIPMILGSCFKKKYFYVLCSLALMCFLLGISGLYNRNPLYGTNALRATLRLILFLAELFALMIWIAERGKEKYAMDFLFWYVLIIVGITDLLFLTRSLVFSSGRHELYLIGTKFTVSYFHMDLLTLWLVRSNIHFYRERKNKLLLAMAMVLIFAVSVRVNCITGVIGCLALFCLFLMMNSKFQKYFLRFTSPMMLLLFLVASVVFPFIAERIVSIPFVTYLLEEVVERSSTLTGRLTIFGKFLSKTQGHLLWGYGINNTYAAAMRLFGCANAQNALLQWTMEAGIAVTVVFVIIMLQIFRQLVRSPRQREIMPMVMLVYVYIIMGTVETTFNMNFILWLALIFMHISTRTPQKEMSIK